MKKSILFSIVFMLFLSFSLSAQERGQRERLTPAEEAKRTVERLHKELKLTDKQQADLTTHYTEAAKKRQEQMSGNQDREKMREVMQKNREANNKKLKEILTEDQYKTYEANEKKREAERGQRGGRGGRN